ncbi:alpha/beta fold hydrolase [Vibrio penaeicida]|uniref:alpha/beta fold hydrolase n=1 Tax=Vibrio penaeicida TaxID=104609 RepID=UPI001F348B8E|nr:alpha/beta hydrolase [Vibrio penaeicida]
MKIWGGVFCIVFISAVVFAQLRTTNIPNPIPNSLGVIERLNADSNTQVLFIHGSPGSKEGYLGYLDYSDLQSIANLVSIDRLGYGASSPMPETSIRRQAQAILPYLSNEKANILVGHSLGGPIALQLALIAPDKVQGMVLVAPAFDPELEHPKWYNYIADTILAKLLLPFEWNQSNIEMMSLSDELKKLASQSWEALKMPIHIVHGEDDDIADPGNSLFAINKLPKQSVKLIQPSDEGHFVLWQNVSLVVESIHQVINLSSNE